MKIALTRRTVLAEGGGVGDGSFYCRVESRGVEERVEEGRIQLIAF